MSEPSDLPALARELGVKSVHLLACARELGLPVRRVAAKLTKSQVEQLRRAHAAGQVKKPQRPKFTPPPHVDPDQSSTCECCELRFTHKASEDSSVCPKCREHYEISNETPERVISRLESHIERWRELRERAVSVAERCRDQTGSALHARDVWRRALVEVAVAHETMPNGACCCGSGKYPCVTRRVLEESNRGIARQVEKFEALREEDLMEFLLGNTRGVYEEDD